MHPNSYNLQEEHPKGQHGSRELGSLLKLCVPQSTALEGMLRGAHGHPSNPGGLQDQEAMERPGCPCKHAVGKQTCLPLHPSKQAAPAGSTCPCRLSTLQDTGACGLGFPTGRRVFEGLSSLSSKQRVLPALQGWGGLRAECLAAPAKAFRSALQKPCTLPGAPASLPLLEAGSHLNAGSLV